MQSEKINQLFNLAEQHHRDHSCSAPPYENGEELVTTVDKYQPKNILEIGTGIGYTAALLALAAPDATVETIEKDSEHVKFAKQFLIKQNLQQRVTITEAVAEQYLSTLKSDSYDLIFFDGFQIHYEFLPHYYRLLKLEGILFLANNHLRSKTYDQFFTELNSSGQWKVLQKFADTTIAQKRG